MDIDLIRTFLEVAATGSFVNASDRLYVTQSAVSLRIQRLEQCLGKQLFTRSKAGAELTPEGREFERYALSILKLWEEARQSVGLPEGFTASLSVGAQYSLWPRLGFRWIDRLRRDLPGLSIRAELGTPERITRFMVEGTVQVAVMYTPQLRPGLTARPFLDEDLVLAASFRATRDDITDCYVFVDWGPKFIHAHALHLPELTHAGLTLSVGAMAAEYVMMRPAAAYLPADYIKPYLDDGRLYLVPDAPCFRQPVWSVWRDDLDPAIRAQAEAALVAVRTQIAEEQRDVTSGIGCSGGGKPVQDPE